MADNETHSIRIINNLKSGNWVAAAAIMRNRDWNMEDVLLILEGTPDTEPTVSRKTLLTFADEARDNQIKYPERATFHKDIELFFLRKLEQLRY